MSATTKPQPNIKFAARPTYDRKKRKRLKDPQPIESFSDRGKVITLPSIADQLANRLFYHDDAPAILAAFPNLYKRIKPKAK